MDEKMFAELMESVREAKAIQRGVKEASRRYVIENPDPRQIRGELGLTQEEFAALMGVSVKTLQNWEQGRRQPEGPARALLIVTAKRPEAVLEALHFDAPQEVS
jgi:putative transcriptional regulator